MRISDWSSDVCSSDLAIFLLASLTKPIVTAAIMRLVEQHRIELDAPVTDWLPDFQPKTADGTTPVITIRQLLTHTAGLTYVFLAPAAGAYHRLGVSHGFDLPRPSPAENIPRLGAVPPSSPPAPHARQTPLQATQAPPPAPP